MKAEILHSEYINRHPYFTARKDAYKLPSGKIVDPYYVVELPVSVAAMAITENNEVILVEQYRHPIGETIIEIPGGFIDEGEEPLDAVKRELFEETGYEFTEFVFLGKTSANPGVLDNFTYLYVAMGGKKTSVQKLDHNEEIDIKLKSIEEVRNMLMNGEIKQSMHALCLFYAFLHLDKR